MLPSVCTRIFRSTALLCRSLSQGRSNVFIDETFLDGGSSAGRTASGDEEIIGSPVLYGAGQRRRGRPPAAWADHQPTARTASSSRDIDLTRAIMEAQEVSQVISLMQSHSTNFNPIHISATLTRLASLVALRGSNVDPGTGTEPDDVHLSVNASLELLSSVAKMQLTTFQPRQLANCSWAAAKLISAGVADHAPMRALASVLLTEAALPGRLNGIQPGEVSLLAWSAHTMKLVNQDLLAALEAAALAAASLSGAITFRFFKDHELVNLLLPFASWIPYSPTSGSQKDNGLLSMVCSDVVRESRLSSMDARHVRSLAYVYAALRFEDMEFSSQLAARMKLVIDQCSPLHLPGVLHSLLLLKCRSHDPAFIIDMMRRIAAAAQIEPPLSESLFGGGYHSSRVSALSLSPLLPILQQETIQALGTPGGHSDHTFVMAVHSFIETVSPAIIQGRSALDAAHALLLLLQASAEDTTDTSSADTTDITTGDSVLMQFATLLVSQTSALASLPIDILRSLVIFTERFVTKTRQKPDAEAVVRVYCFALRTSCLSRLAEFHPADHSELLKCLMLPVSAV